jgi:hypothetical protein
MRLALLATAACLLASPAFAKDQNHDVDANCTFDRGVTICTYVSQRSETLTRVVYSGCVVGPFFPPQPGRRVTTYEDTYLVTTTTTTYQHGRHGKIYDSTTTVERVLESSRLVSSVCEPL